MRGAAPLVRLVATLGVLIVLQGLAGQKLWDNDFHQVDQFLPTHNYTLHEWFGFDGAMGRVVVQEDRLILLGIAIVLTFALWAFTRFTRIGLAISASAENERAVSALGWSPNFLATVTWAIGGATAGFAGILLAPNAGLSLTVFTIVVTVSALAVALIGGFSSFPLTLLGGIALGIAETEVLTYSSDISTFLHDTLGIENGATGLQRALPFLVIVVVLVVRGKALPLRSHVLERLPDLGSGVVTRWFLVVIVGGLLLLNGFAFDAKWSTAVYTTLIVGVFILSIVVLTGYAGQLSLAQYAIGGLGALVASRLVGQEHWPAELAFLAGVVFAILVGTVFAIPALRTRGVNLAVVTLGLGFAVQQVVFSNQYFTGDFGSVTTIGRISVFGWDVSAADHPDRYLVVCLGVFVIAALMVANLRRSGSGRRLIAVRNNERAAASLGISVFGAKLYAFSVGAAIAAFAGILLAFKDSTVVYTRYDPFQSINTVGNAVAGGVGWVLGAVFGGNLAPGGLGSIPLDWIDLGSWLITIGGVTLILIVILNPNGIASVVLNDERGIGKLRLRLRRTPPREQLVDVAPSEVTPATLEIEDLTVRFGAVVAVDGVSFRVSPREVVGLIGPNGAGKTTIVDALTGFTKPSCGPDPPQRRADGRAVVEPGPACARGRPPFVPVARALRGDLGRREPARRRRRALAVRRPPRPGLAGPAAPAADRGEQRPRVRARAGPRPAPGRALRTADAGSSGSPGRSRRRRRCCCSTSRPPASTTTRPASSAISSAASPTGRAWPCSSSSTTSSSCSGSATGSWWSTSGARSPRARPPRSATIPRSSPRTSAKRCPDVDADAAGQRAGDRGVRRERDREPWRPAARVPRSRRRLRRARGRARRRSARRAR